MMWTPQPATDAHKNARTGSAKSTRARTTLIWKVIRMNHRDRHLPSQAPTQKEAA